MVHAEGRAATVAGPVYLLLFPVPVVCFLAALIADTAYYASAFLMWLHFSQWMIAAGLVFGALAALVLLVEFFASDGMRRTMAGWTHLVLFYACLVVQLFNAFVHTADGWTAVVPNGLTLSIVGAILALGAVWSLFFVPVTWFEVRGARP
jgi:uncharacterized membrane protein